MSLIALAALLHLGIITSPEQCTQELINQHCDQIRKVKNNNEEQLKKILKTLEFNSHSNSIFIIDESTQT